jgi:hypothetical protein
VIKRIRFAGKRPDLQAEVFSARWRMAFLAAAGAPAMVRPLRVAVCISLPEVLANPLHDAVGMEWFSDLGHLDRYEQWLGAPEGKVVSERLEAAVDLAASPLMLADELVLRGAPWLDERWRQGGAKLKHMAIARRATGLSEQEFSQRWKGRAGTLGSAGGSVVTIPDEARGCAYVQNHLRPGSAGESYDALNEVYFENPDLLRFRIEWFAQNLGDRVEADLVSGSWFIAVSEDPIRTSPPNVEIPAESGS